MYTRKTCLNTDYAKSQLLSDVVTVNFSKNNKDRLLDLITILKKTIIDRIIFENYFKESDFEPLKSILLALEEGNSIGNNIKKFDINFESGCVFSIEEAQLLFNIDKFINKVYLKETYLDHFDWVLLDNKINFDIDILTYRIKPTLTFDILPLLEKMHRFNIRQLVLYNVSQCSHYPELMKSLATLTSVTHLSISQAKFDLEQAKLLSQLIRAFPRLSALDIADAKFTSDGINELIAKLPSLNQLFLTGTNPSKKILSALDKLNNLSSLTNLALGGSPNTKRYLTKDIAIQLVSLLSKCTRLQYFTSCSYNYYTQEPYLMLVNALNSLPHFTKLDLENFFYKKEPLNPMELFLKESKSNLDSRLEYISLADNYKNRKFTLPENFFTMPCLSYVNLRNTVMHEDQLQQLAVLLPKTELLYLDLADSNREMELALQRNRRKAILWTQAAFIIRSLQAVKDHPFALSLLRLLPIIMIFADEQEHGDYGYQREIKNEKEEKKMPRLQKEVLSHMPLVDVPTFMKLKFFESSMGSASLKSSDFFSSESEEKKSVVPKSRKRKR